MIEINRLSRRFGDMTVLDNIQLNISPGSFTAILGRNGSGKSTLARHMNVILKPQAGSVTVNGMDTADDNLTYDIREHVGMVLQNPDSQSVAAIVEDDTAFGPENLGLSEEETAERVKQALDAAGISGLRKKSISTLSGGQKQLAAIAGIIAMRPEYIIFDEGTSMLDPASRGKILSSVKGLQKEYNIAIIWITHYMDEAAQADRVIVINNGSISADGSPREVFSDVELIKNSGLELPFYAELAYNLRSAGMPIDKLPLDTEECALMIADILKKGGDCNA